MAKKKSTVNKAGNYTKPGMRKRMFNSIMAGSKGGKPGQAKIVKGVDDSTADYILGHHIHATGDAHPFSTGDFIAVEDNSTSPAIDSNFLSAGTAGKKITAVVGNKISTDIDSSSASADYTYAFSGNQAIVKRCIKIVAATSTVIVEEVQVVGG